MMDPMLAPLRAPGWIINARFRLGLALVLLTGAVLAGFVLVKGSQPSERQRLAIISPA